MASTPHKKIIPFVPKSFPPKNIRHALFSKELKRAERDLEKYATTLSALSSPETILKAVIPLESILSLSSHKIKGSLFQVFQARIKPEKQLGEMGLILNHIHALTHATQKKRGIPLNKASLCALHRAIKWGSPFKKDLGVFRKRQNWIGPDKCTIEEAYYYPPAASQVMPLMEKLFQYARKNEKEPLLQLCLFLNQFLIIHPFMDGNGRMARLTIPLFLYRKKLIPFPFFFMSRYFKQHRLRYFESLYKTTERGQWEPWILFFLKGISIEAKRNGCLLRKLEDLYQKLYREGVSKKVLHFLFLHPVFLSSSFPSKTALSFLQQKNGIVKRKGNVYVFTPLLKILRK